MVHSLARVCSRTALCTAMALRKSLAWHKGTAYYKLVSYRCPRVAACYKPELYREYSRTEFHTAAALYRLAALNIPEAGCNNTASHKCLVSDTAAAYYTLVSCNLILAEECNRPACYSFRHPHTACNRLGSNMGAE